MLFLHTAVGVGGLGKPRPEGPAWRLGHHRYLPGSSPELAPMLLWLGLEHMEPTAFLPLLLLPALARPLPPQQWAGGLGEGRTCQTAPGMSVHTAPLQPPGHMRARLVVGPAVQQAAVALGLAGTGPLSFVCLLRLPGLCWGPARTRVEDRSEQKPGCQMLSWAVTETVARTAELGFRNGSSFRQHRPINLVSINPGDNRAHPVSLYSKCSRLEM